MKKFLCLLLIVFSTFAFVSCGAGEPSKEIELMGAGDRIHDTFTFANTGVSISDDGNDRYTISGTVEKLESESVKDEFKIDGDVENVVVIKLTAIGKNVVQDEVEIMVNGSRAYDAEHLNGSDYTFIILEAKKNSTAFITAKWNSQDEGKTYAVYFDQNIVLK